MWEIPLAILLWEVVLLVTSPLWVPILILAFAFLMFVIGFLFTLTCAALDRVLTFFDGKERQSRVFRVGRTFTYTRYTGPKKEPK